MLTVSELAKQSGSPSHVVRYYLRIGLIQPAGKQDNGYRLFTSMDVTRLRFVRLAKHLGFTLNEIKQILRHADEGESPCEDVREIIRHRIQEHRDRIEEMMTLQVRMEDALEQWKLMPNGVPDGNSICHLIESIKKHADNESRDTET